MEFETDTDFQRIPGLYRLWDLQLVIQPGDEYRVHYAEMTADSTPLFAVYRQRVEQPCQRGCSQ